MGISKVTVRDKIEVTKPARIEITAANMTITVDEDGDLVITKQDGSGLMIMPSASNQIIIKNESIPLRVRR